MEEREGGREGRTRSKIVNQNMSNQVITPCVTSFQDNVKRRRKKKKKAQSVQREETPTCCRNICRDSWLRIMLGAWLVNSNLPGLF